MTDLAPPPLLLRSVERGVLTLTLNGRRRAMRYRWR